MHTSAANSSRVQQFQEEHLNGYLKFHRPCGQVEIVTDRKGRQRRR